MSSIPTASSASKKPRASKPKVRSGCLTCKQRRVKCDETKPACLRCSNFGRVCGGYPSMEEPSPPKHLSPPVRRKLLSKAMQIAPAPSPSPEPQTAAFAPRPSVSSVPPQIPVGVTFQDETEYQYFCHFRDTTAIELSDGFGASLWNPFVLSACDNPSIRRLVVATAALSIAVKTNPLTLRNPSIDQHHQYALQQYGQALRGIREMGAAGQDSIRIMLISALLIFCFETLHGDLSRAVFHIRSAVDMIVKTLASLPQAHYFPRLSTAGTHPQAPIDNELLSAFIRIDRPSLALMTGSPDIEANRIFNLLFVSEQLEMPHNFNTIDEARVCLEDIVLRILPSKIPPENFSMLWNEGQEPAISDCQWVPGQLKRWFDFCDLPNVSGHLSQRLVQWHDAFSPLLNYAMSAHGEALFVPAAIMHVQALASELVMTGFFPLPTSEARSSSTSSIRSTSLTDTHASPMSGEASTRKSSLVVPEANYTRGRESDRRHSPFFGDGDLFPTVHALLNFSRQLSADSRFSKGFVFDSGIICPLSIVSMMCPDRSLRQQAIEVLRSMEPRREGIWDSRVCAAAGDRELAREGGQVSGEMIDPMFYM